MVVENSALTPFTTVKYTTKDGENCTATKNNGIVTVTGDKNGVRQMPVEEFMKNLAENLPKTNLEKTPAKDKVSFSGNNEQNKSSKSLIGWLTALGLAAIGAGVYFATKGKGGSDIAEAAGNTIKKGKEKLQNAVDSIAENIKPKTEEAISDAAPAVKPAVTKPAPTKPAPVVVTPAKPAAAKPKNNAPKEAPAQKIKQEKTSAKKTVQTQPAQAKPVPEKPAVVEQKVNQAIEELPLIEAGTKPAAFKSETDDLLRQAEKKAEQEKRQAQEQLNNDAIATAIILDDGWKTGGKKATEAVEELFPKGEELFPKGEKALDDIADIKPHSSTYDDIYKPIDDLDDYTDITSSHLDDFSNNSHFDDFNSNSYMDDFNSSSYFDDFSSNSYMDDATDFMDDGFGF